jgi:cysteine desulfurase
VVTSPIEHKAVLAAAHEVAHEGGEERTLEVDANGVVRNASYDELVRDDVAVTSVMWVNNETGVIQDIPELARRAKSRGVMFHTDAVQGFGKVAIDARTQPFDLLSISGHKIGAPKGIGALFIRRGTPFEPLIRGGSQDRGRRAGTENLAFVVGLATAAELAVAERQQHWDETERMRDRLEALLLESIPDAIVHSRGAKRAPHVLNISVPGTDNESMLMALDLRGIACSGGSACQSGSLTPSHVLEAMGVDPVIAGAAVRMSFGSINTEADVDRVADVFCKLVAKARTAISA